MASSPWPTYDRLVRNLQRIQDPDFGPLMVKWEKIIVEGNRRGVLSGLDGNNRPMAPLKYRNGGGKPTANRKKGSFGTDRSRTQESTGDNLAAFEYKALTGPRLAPRRAQSRVITNLLTAHGRDPGNNYGWFAEGAWVNVKSRKGYHFLVAHFDPQPGSHLPRYDLRYVRPEDQFLAVSEMRDFIEKTFRFR